MKWRCAGCGKPHESDDPPCEDCGHDTFERAVRQAPGESAGPSEPVWVCTECGRTHMKNNPPCSRCGNHTFEQREPDYDLTDVAVPSYRELIEPWHVAGLAVALVLGGVLVLGATGVVDLPGVGPSLPEAPGQSESVGSLSLAEVESASVEAINADRAERNIQPLERDDEAQFFATYVNRRRVAIDHGDGDPLTEGELREVAPRCGGDALLESVEVTPPRAVDSYGPAALADVVLADSGGLAGATTASHSRIGVDVHVAPDGTVYVTVLVC